MGRLRQLYAVACRCVSFAIVIALVPLAASAQTALLNFVDAPRGPAGGLLPVGQDLYGVMQTGGAYDLGAVYKISSASPNTAQFVSSVSSGRMPEGRLLQDPNGALWGTTSHGGSADAGTIFRVSLSTNPATATTQFNFTGTNGANPVAGMTAVGSFNPVFYGVTENGGAGSNTGTIFRVASGTLTTLYSFPNTINAGAHPTQPLVAIGNVLYGTTYDGGASGVGTVFKYDTSTSTFTTLFSFGSANGAHPNSTLTLYNSFVYGTTTTGGTQNAGTIYRLDPNTGTVTSVFSFGTGTGLYPTRSGLTVNGSYLYGTTQQGGSGSFGTVFEFDPATNAITNSTSLPSTTASGMSGPDSDLVLYGGMLYGTASPLEDANALGSIFRYDPIAHTVTTLFSLGTDDPRTPLTTLISSGSQFWSTTANGGSSRSGTAYRFDAAGPTTTTTSFDAATTGASPAGNLVASFAIYGVARAGGAYNCGTVYTVDPTTMSVSALASISIPNGTTCGPTGPLVLAGDGYLYGSTSSPGSPGSVFRVDPATGATATIVSGVDVPNLVDLQGLLYTASGSTVNAIDPNTGAETLVANLDATTGYDAVSLTTDGTSLYGAARSGGTSGSGTIFRVDPATGQTYALCAFSSGGTAGYAFQDPVTIIGSFLYGSTTAGGASQLGTLFKVNLGTGALSTVFPFTRELGYAPRSAPIACGPYICGSSSAGGISGGGVLYTTDISPSITPAAAVSRTAGSAATSATIATVSDTEDGAGTLAVTAITVPAGITVSGIANTAGTISATVGATCAAAAGANVVTLRVMDGGWATRTSPFTVNVITNPAPTLGTYSDTTVNAAQTCQVTPSTAPSDNGSVTVTVAASAGFSGTATADSGTGVITISNPNAGTFTMTVTATDNCGATATRTFTLTVTAPPGAPQNFSATATTATSVALSWVAGSGATQYEIWRNTNPNAPYATTSAVSFVDSAVAANTTYIYKIRSVAGTAYSAFTPVDAATTVMFTDDPLAAGTESKAVHVQELRTAVNAMRVAAGLATVQFTDDPLNSGTTVIRAVHIMELRSALDAARSAITLPPLTYTDATITSGATVLKAVHIRELRNGVK